MFQGISRGASFPQRSSVSRAMPITSMPPHQGEKKCITIGKKEAKQIT